MRRPIVVVTGIVILLILVLFSMTYTVSFHEVGIKSRFGQTTDESVIREAGLHFRLPFFADSVTLLDTRLKIHQSPLEMLLQGSLAYCLSLSGYFTAKSCKYFLFV